MWNKKFIYRVLLFLAAMLPNIIALISGFWFKIDRPLFIYEYLLVFVFMAFNIHFIYIWIFYVFFILLDLANIFSKIYLFNLSNFINNLKYFHNYSINVNQMIALIFSTFFLIGLLFYFKIIKKNIGNDKRSLQLFILIFAIIFTLDNVNGSSFKRFQKNINFYKGNLAGFPTNEFYHLIIASIDFNNTTPIPNSFNRESITFKQFAPDTTNNQLLIIVESMGLIEDTIKRMLFQRSVSYIFQQYKWETNWGKTHFTGGTTSAELRELLNCVGNYNYFINSKNAKNFNSIFQIKKQQGYHINAIHSFKGDMFQRYIWWKNIGIDNVYFRENIQSFYNYKLNLNYNTNFISVNDEDAFNFIQASTSNEGKQFSYLLTENSHLPFMSNIDKPIFAHLFDIDNEIYLSEEAKNQHKRIYNFLFYVASHLDSNKFQSILIVGDHMPPFVKKNDRKFYNTQFVPYCIVTK